MVEQVADVSKAICFRLQHILDALQYSSKDRLKKQRQQRLKMLRGLASQCHAAARQQFATKGELQQLKRLLEECRRLL